jgi:hypothetical protein
MSETSEEQNSVARTWSWTWQVLGVLLGTATAIKNGFAIDVYGLPAKVLAQYIWLRDTLFAPVAWAVRYFGVEIEWWVKDAIMAYVLVAAAHARAYEVLKAYKYDVDPDDDPLSRYERMLWATERVRAAALWPRTTGQLLRECALAIEDRIYFARHTHSPEEDRTLYNRIDALEAAKSSITDGIKELGHIGLQVIVISVATMAFFLWNYLSGLYGPT